jgi:hypothetical protein
MQHAPPHVTAQVGLWWYDENNAPRLNVFQAFSCTGQIFIGAEINNLLISHISCIPLLVVYSASLMPDALALDRFGFGGYPSPPGSDRNQTLS